MKALLCQKIKTLLSLDSAKTYRCLDIGCGSGELLGTLSTAISPDSELYGIDEMSESIKHAKANYLQDNCPRIKFSNEKFIDSLPFEDNSFDIVLSVDTLECIPDKTALIDEVFRVLKPDGKVTFAHWDWDTQVYNSENKESIRKFCAAFSDWKQDWMDDADGRMGRQLWGLFEGSGKFKGNIECFTLLETEYEEGNYGFDRLEDLSGLVEAGEIERDEYQMICREMHNLAQNKKYFYSVNSYIYAGKPLK